MIKQLGYADITHCIFCSNLLHSYDRETKTCRVCPQEVAFDKDGRDVYSIVIVNNLNGWAVEFDKQCSELSIMDSPEMLDYDYYQMTQPLFEQLMMGLYYLPDLLKTLEPTVEDYGDDGYDDIDF